MEDTNPNKRIRPRSKNKITLQPTNLQKVEDWLTTLTASREGVAVKASDLVNWIIETAPQVLLAADAKSLQSRFFDEVKYLKSLVKTAREFRASGEKMNLEKVLNAEKRPKVRGTRPSRRNQKLAESLDQEAPSPTHEQSLSDIPSIGMAPELGRNEGM